MSVRNSYVERFGEQQAAALEDAAVEHNNDVHPNKGSDPFKWVVLICIGYECVEKPDFAKHHGITVPWADFKSWAIANGELKTHDGDCDYIALFVGKYNEFVGAEPFEAA